MTRLTTRIASKLTAAATATALVLGMASPAAAMNQKDRGALAIILGLGATALIIDGMNDKQRRPAPAPVYRAPDRHETIRHWPRDIPRPVAGYVPAQCLETLRSRNGQSRVVSDRCVDRSRARLDLPRSCAFDIRTRYGVEKVYGMSCLEDRGYRVAGQR